MLFMESFLITYFLNVHPLIVFGTIFGKNNIGLDCCGSYLRFG